MSVVWVLSTRSADEAVFVLLGALCLVAAALPLLLRKKFHVFEPAVFASISVFIGATARSLYLIYTDNSEIILKLTDGLSFSELLPGASAAVLGLTSYSIGYLATGKRFRGCELPILSDRYWSDKTVLGLVVISSILAVIGLFLFLQTAGIQITTLSDVSKKRVVEVDGAGTLHTVAALGYLRAISLFGHVGFLVAVAWAAYRFQDASPRWKVTYSVLVASGFFVASAHPFIASARTSVLILGLGVVIIFAYARGRLPWLKIVAVGALLLVIALIMLELRTLRAGANELELQRGIFEDGVLVGVFDGITGSGNFFPIARSGVIVDRVPERLDFQNGSTYLAILAAPIPRRIWPEKPIIAVGRIVRYEIWWDWAAAGGYPPGIVGEAFMNFGWVGVVVVPALLGFVVRLWYNSLLPGLGKSKSVLVLYAMMIWPVGQQMVQLNFSLALVNALTAAIVTLAGLGIMRLMYRPANLPGRTNVGRGYPPAIDP